MTQYGNMMSSFQKTQYGTSADLKKTTRNIKNGGGSQMIRPSTSFLSQGRSKYKMDCDHRNLTYFPKKHEQKLNSVSILAYREQTLKSQGYETGFDQDIKIFEALQDQSKMLKSQIDQMSPGKAENRVESPEKMRQNL